MPTNNPFTSSFTFPSIHVLKTHGLDFVYLVLKLFESSKKGTYFSGDDPQYCSINILSIVNYIYLYAKMKFPLAVFAGKTRPDFRLLGHPEQTK